MSWEELKAEGNAAFQNNSYADALRAYTDAIALAPNEAVLWGNRALVHTKMGNHEGALTDARKCVEVDPRFTKGYARWVGALAAMGKFAAAASAATEALAALSAAFAPAAAPPETVGELRRWHREATDTAAALEKEAAEMSAGAGFSPETVSAVIMARQRFPEVAAVSLALARCRAQVDPDAAFSILTKISRSLGEDISYLVTRAFVQYYRGMEGIKQARQILQAVLQLDPENAVAARLLKKLRRLENCREGGNAAYRDKKFSEAIAQYSEALDIDPQNKRIAVVIRGNRAAAYLDMGDAAKALEDCTAAIDGGNDAPKMFARRSRANELLEKWDDAVRDITRASEGDPATYRNELANCKARARQGKRKDFYKILGVSRETSVDDIKRAYKRAALQWHPDRWSHGTDEEKAHAEAKFKELGEALSILSDPQKRRLYDNGQLDNDTEGANHGMGGMGGMHHFHQDIFSMFGGMPMGGMGGNGSNFYFSYQ